MNILILIFFIFLPGCIHVPPQDVHIHFHYDTELPSSDVVVDSDARVDGTHITCNDVFDGKATFK